LGTANTFEVSVFHEQTCNVSQENLHEKIIFNKFGICKDLIQHDMLACAH
jgi:hypothetical protein